MNFQSTYDSGLQMVTSEHREDRRLLSSSRMRLVGRSTVRSSSVVRSAAAEVIAAAAVIKSIRSCVIRCPSVVVVERGP